MTMNIDVIHKRVNLFILLACAGIVAVLFFSGCAMNPNTATLRTFYEDGNLETEDIIKQNTITTVFAKVHEGAGDFRYSGDENGFEVEAGNAVKGMEAGDLESLIQGFVQLGKIAAPFLQNLSSSSQSQQSPQKIEPSSLKLPPSFVESIVSEVFNKLRQQNDPNSMNIKAETENFPIEF